ncbi:MAG: DEAD/DEAH box helicase [Flavobacteriales bacterium]|jgi:superfamily II DNA/RNA helicase|nr:DEAD/DEAH box helicase [Flavobacteriales bacterium]MBT4705004.1 DEAD/DEAH box helicase [Flavobacteriales bacterium]MBT4929779.1 DEAD/DEAH box helicase [Flavobacteriales bacterium]MBT5133248.1 DEAD/DEAH box helicase [Flavobacteriales bacterium]MBT6131867.1 DEAD/DEAH box helicase [Flavobacteriales bacterium]
MSETQDPTQRILDKMGIESLNDMQQEALSEISKLDEVVLLSPTGTGKTLAFVLPLLETLKIDATGVQLLILVPSRELAIQIEQVIRGMGSGFKINAFYGGQSFSKDREGLKQTPSILIGTPGRIADHLRRNTFTTKSISALVLDEFDKMLEVGFEREMKEITRSLNHLNKKILTSASQNMDLPDFVRMNRAKKINYLHQGRSQLELKAIISPTKDKLETLVKALAHLGNKPGIVFCNFKESIQRVSEHLEEHQITHGCFHGDMEQQDRERALIKFRNGTHQLIVATDLAARGLDIPEIEFILHYHMPNREHEFTHRNGRTARMLKGGTAYILQGTQERMPDYLEKLETEELSDSPMPAPSEWTTLFISGGRRDKISKGDIAGLFFKQGGLGKDQLGLIEIKHDCAFLSVHKDVVTQVTEKLDNSRLKKKKVRIRVI